MAIIESREEDQWIHPELDDVPAVHEADAGADPADDDVARRGLVHANLSLVASMLAYRTEAPDHRSR